MTEQEQVEEQEQTLKLFHGILQGGRYLCHVWAYTAKEAANTAVRKYDEAHEGQVDYQQLFLCGPNHFREISPSQGGGTFHFTRR